MKASDQLREHVLGALSFKNAVSIRQALDIAASVEHRLEDPQKPGARETVRIDLIWVQGVKMKTPGLELPSPEIASNGYLAFYFEESIHSMGLEAFPDKGERDHMVKTIKNAPDVQEGGWGMNFDLSNSLGFYRQPDHNEWTDSGPDKADSLHHRSCIDRETGRSRHSRATARSHGCEGDQRGTAGFPCSANVASRHGREFLRHRARKDRGSRKAKDPSVQGHSN
jgi:hypothetical protein